MRQQQLIGLINAENCDRPARPLSQILVHISVQNSTALPTEIMDEIEQPHPLVTG